MKSLIVLAGLAAFALGHAIATLPDAAASMRTVSAVQAMSVTGGQ